MKFKRLKIFIFNKILLQNHKIRNLNLNDGCKEEVKLNEPEVQNDRMHC